MGKIELFTLLGNIFVDNSEALQSIEETDKKAEGLSGKFKNGMKTAGKWGAAIGGAAIAGGTALFGMASKASDATDEIDKMSQKIGISREGFQEYSYILSQSGTDISVLQRGFKTLTDRMDESIEGTGKGAEAFDALGLSAVDLNGNMKTQEQMFEEATKALMAMPEGAEKSSLAFDLFGKAGQELMPLLNGTAEEMDGLRQNAHDMGLVLSDDAIDAGAQFTDTMDDVKRSLGAVVANIGVELMPIFQTFLDWVLDHMPEIQAVIKKVFENIAKFVKVVIDIFQNYLLPVFQAIFDWTRENWPAIQKIIEGVFSAIKVVWENVLKPVLGILLEILGKVVDFVQRNWPTIQKVFETVFKAIKIVWDNILEPVLTILWDVLKGIFDFVSTVFSGVSGIFEVTFGAIGKAVEKVTGFFTKLVDGIKSAWEWLTKWNDEPVKDKEPKTGNIGGGSARRSLDGIHKTGLNRVPFDGYSAMLHEGERVLTKQESEGYEKQNIAGEIVKALKEAGLTKPAVIMMDGRAVGKGVVNVIDSELKDKSETVQIGKGVLR